MQTLVSTEKTFEKLSIDLASSQIGKATEINL